MQTVYLVQLGGWKYHVIATTDTAVARMWFMSIGTVYTSKAEAEAHCVAKNQELSALIQKRQQQLSER